MNVIQTSNLIWRERQMGLLTPRQQQVCAMLCGGLTTLATAALLKVSAKAVEYHRLQVYRKLGMDNLATLTKWALRCGLTTL